MTDHTPLTEQQTGVERDRQILAAAPHASDDWDDATWAAWWRTCERIHGDGPAPAAACPSA